MFASLGLTISGLIFSVLIAIVYFSKKRYNNLGDKIYRISLILTILMFLVEFGFVFAMNYGELPLVRLLSSIYVFLCIIWFLLLTLYVWSLDKMIGTNNASLQRTVYILVTIGLVAFMVFLFLPTTYTSGNNNELYVIGGKSVSVLYALGAISSVYIFYSLIKNRKKVSLIKRLPIFLFMFFIVITTVVQLLYDDINDLTFLFAGCMVIMYFTLENQDLKLVDELEKAKAEAEKASVEQSEFLSNMSHEIRTPMNAIMGFSEALTKNDNIDKETLKKDVKNIYEASNSLLTVINNILDISRLETSKEVVQKQKYNIKDLLQNAIDVSVADLKDSVKFNTVIDSNVPSKLIGDEYKITKVLSQVLLNAVNNTDTGRITLSLSYKMEEEKAILIFKISDTGIGIKEEDFDKVFQKFTKLSQKNEKDGTGLGLVITKKLVELMDGDITFESKYGKGTTFEITLPQEVYDKTPIGKIDFSGIENKFNYFDGSKYNVLVVDDSKTNLRVMEKLLLPYKVNIKTISNGSDCLEDIKENKYDLIFLDHLMPGIDGLQLLKILNKTLKKKIPPVVALTANVSYNASKLYVDKGFSDYLAKPIDIRELDIILKKYLFDNKKKEGDE